MQIAPQIIGPIIIVIQIGPLIIGPIIIVIQIDQLSCLKLTEFEAPRKKIKGDFSLTIPIELKPS